MSLIGSVSAGLFKMNLCNTYGLTEEEGMQNILAFWDKDFDCNDCDVSNLLYTYNTLFTLPILNPINNRQIKHINRTIY